MKMKRSYLFFCPFFAAVFASLALLSAACPADADENNSDKKEAYDSIALFTRVLEQVRSYYADQEKVEYRELIYGALEGMLHSLDPHSSFMDPDMYADMKDDTAGAFGGLGIVVTLRDGVLTIVSPMEDTPGSRAGLLPGDRIVGIDGKSTEGFSLQEAVKSLRGEPGTTVTLRVLRPETQEVTSHTLERAVIEVSSVKDAELLDGRIGYVRATQFDERTALLLKEALVELVEQGMEALILDLRNNPGGLLTSAVEVSELFLKRRAEIVSTKGRTEDGDQEQVYRAQGSVHYLNFPMVVLVNEGSASAAEIVSGALQDHKRAVLVGEKTFGKGSIQSVFVNDDGSAIRLTTAKYYTPNGRLIHEKGIEPDIRVPLSVEMKHRIFFDRSAFEASESAGEPEPDPQLERALDVLKGIRVFQSKSNRAFFTGRIAGKPETEMDR